MITIAATNVSALVGKHDHVTESEAFRKLLFKTRPTIRTSFPLKKKVEQELSNTSFYKWYTSARTVTPRMRRMARSLVNATCKQYKLSFGKPYSFFAKARGVYWEPRCIFMYENMVRRVVTKQQMKCSKIIKNKSGVEFEIRGSIDGICDGSIIEVKSKSVCLKTIPVWEIIQLSVYCWILQMPGILLTIYNNTIKEHLVSLDDATEMCMTLLPILRTKIDKCHRLTHPDCYIQQNENLRAIQAPQNK